MTRNLRRLAAVLGIAAAAALGGGLAYASTSAGPPVTSPPGTVGPYYSGPVHECVSAASESTVYIEEHTDAIGNCAAGYRQLVANELTPVFSLELNGAALTCTADTGGAETALSCSSPSPAPSSSTSG